jgi:hypothetical protein
MFLRVKKQAPDRAEVGRARIALQQIDSSVYIRGAPVVFIIWYLQKPAAGDDILSPGWGDTRPCSCRYGEIRPGRIDAYRPAQRQQPTRKASALRRAWPAQPRLVSRFLPRGLFGRREFLCRNRILAHL